jgi:hypothetical protein
MTAEQIVRALAAARPVASDGLCGVCDGWDSELMQERHEPDCPWRLAVEWVAAQGSGQVFASTDGLDAFQPAPVAAEQVDLTITKVTRP